MNKSYDSTNAEIEAFIYNNDIYRIVSNMAIPDEIYIQSDDFSVIMGHTLSDREIENTLRTRTAKIRNNYQSLGLYINLLIENKLQDYPDILKRLKEVGITRQYKHKLINNKCRPSKKKLLCLAVGLRLSTEETEALLRKAEFSFLVDLDDFDCIIAFFMEKDIYSIMKIDEYLKHFGQPTLFSIA